MRKIFLSVFVILSFVLYAYTMRVKSAAQTQVILPNALGKRIVVTPTITPPPIPTTTSKVSQSTTVIQPTEGIQLTTTPQPIVPIATSVPSSQFKDGTFTGSVADAFYGNVQVQVTISGGKITGVQFLQAPNDQDTSASINQQADPVLTQEAVQAQSANVDIVSGATQTSQAFIESMQSALSKAKS